MKKAILILGLLLASSFLSVKGQEVSYHISLDSDYVTNNAVVMRTNGNNIEYIMMPTLYDTTSSIGQLVVVKVDAVFGSNAVNVYRYGNLDGMVVTDMVVGSNNIINFAGYRNGEAIYGTLGNNYQIKYKKDNNTLYSKAISYSSFTGYGGYLLTGDQWTNNRSSLASFASSSTLSLNGARSFRDLLSIVDVVLSQHTTMSSAYGISLSHTSTQQMALAIHNLGDLGTSAVSREIVNLPTHWSWHERGGSIVRIDADRYVVAIDTRCDTVEKDGIWLVKFAVTSNQITIYGSQLLEFPSQKVIVKDMICINDATYGNKLFVTGQFIDATDTSAWSGCPFVLKTDTSFLPCDVKRYATHYTDYGMRNFQLNKLCYDPSSRTLLAAGSYCKYGSATIGGIYLASIDPFSTTIPTYPCTVPIPIEKLQHGFTPTTMQPMGGMTKNEGGLTKYPTSASTKSVILDCMPVLFSDKKLVNNTHGVFLYQDGERMVLQNIDEGVHYEIFDVTGAMVMKGASDSSINISSLKHGLYVIRISSHGKIIATEKFVK